MTADPQTTGSGDSRTVFAWKCGRIWLSVSEAADEGWRYAGGPVRRFGVSDFSITEARGLGIIVGRRLISVWLKNRGVA